MGGRDRQRPAQDPPTRTRAGAALPPARPGQTGNLGLADRALRARSAHRPGRRGRRPRPDRISFTRALRIVRRTATGTAAFPLRTGTTPYPQVLAEIARNPPTSQT